jgi:zinc resistance-associated protein
MIRYAVPALAALAVCAFGVTATTAAGESSSAAGMERMQHWAADHEALLDAGLAGLKAALKLTPDQEKNWAPFEAAVRDAAKMRMEQAKAMMDRVQKMRDWMEHMQDTKEAKDMGAAGQAISPIDRLEAMAQRMSERGAALKKVADAAQPLYASLDDSQKHIFRLLGHEMMMMGHGYHRMGMMGGGWAMMGQGGMGMLGQGGMGMLGQGGRGMMGQGGMGMMGREPHGMNMMGGQWDDEGDNSDEE